MIELVPQALYSGVLNGGSYALIALGLALVFGTMKIINLAHGEMVLLAAYVAYSCEKAWGASPLVTIPLAIAVVCVAMVATYSLVSRIKSDREINSLLLTFGIGIILTNAILLVWTSDVRSTKSAWLQEPVVLGPLYSVRGEILFFGIGAGLIAALWWWLRRTWYGRALRAVASDRDAARLMGIEPRAIELVSFVVAGLLAAVAGVAIYAVWRDPALARRESDREGLHHHRPRRIGLRSGRADRRDPAGRHRVADDDVRQLGAAGARGHGALSARAVRPSQRLVRYRVAADMIPAGAAFR